jgi:hypothetical protein
LERVRRFGGAYHIHLRSIFSPASGGFSLEPEDEGDVPPKRRILTELQGVTTQNTVLFIATAVETSNKTYVNTNSGSFITRYFVFSLLSLF